MKRCDVISLKWEQNARLSKQEKKAFYFLQHFSTIGAQILLFCIEMQTCNSLNKRCCLQVTLMLCLVVYITNVCKASKKFFFLFTPLQSYIRSCNLELVAFFLAVFFPPFSMFVALIVFAHFWINNSVGN